MKPRSLRSRLIIGSVFWTLGLLAMTHLVSRIMVSLFPERLQVVHLSIMSLIAVVLMFAGLTQVRSGMSPLNQLRARLSAVRDGRAPRIEGRYPLEVEPLIQDLNTLLEQREQAVQRAHAKAGDLAHGLKTPLAVLSQEAERAAAAGNREIASRISQQVERMSRQMDYHLAHARAAAAGSASGARSQLRDSAEGLARTLQRLHADRGISIQVDVASEHSVRSQREDLDEMLGNLLDNACKWARSRVVVDSTQTPTGVELTIDDDGPGLAASMRERVLQRGVRADLSAPGSGFGLAIVRDLAELYGGSIQLQDSPLGGLRATLHLHY